MLVSWVSSLSSSSSSPVVISAPLLARTLEGYVLRAVVAPPPGSCENCWCMHKSETKIGDRWIYYVETLTHTTHTHGTERRNGDGKLHIPQSSWPAVGWSGEQASGAPSPPSFAARNINSTCRRAQNATLSPLESRAPSQSLFGRAHTHTTNSKKRQRADTSW